MIAIPKMIKKRKNRMSNKFYHYELQEDKCTDRLIVYKCIENNCLETWQKRDFIKTEDKK